MIAAMALQERPDGQGVGRAELAGGGDKLGASPPVTPLDGLVTHGRGLGGNRGSSEDEASSSGRSGLATPDRAEGDQQGSASAEPRLQPSPRRTPGRDAAVQTCDDGGEEVSAAEAARCLQIALRFAQQQQSKPGAKLAAAVQTLATFVDLHGRPRPQQRRVRRSKPAGDKEERHKKRLTASQKQLLKQQVPEDFVVSDAISVKPAGAGELSTPRFKAASMLAVADVDDELEDTSDEAFGILHRPREQQERDAHKHAFDGPSRPGRSPRGVSGVSGASPQAVAPLSLAGAGGQRAPIRAPDPDDWEVVAPSKRKAGKKNCIVLRKTKRKRNRIEETEQERKLLRAAVFGRVASRAV